MFCTTTLIGLDLIQQNQFHVFTYTFLHSIFPLIIYDLYNKYVKNYYTILLKYFYSSSCLRESVIWWNFREIIRPNTLRF